MRRREPACKRSFQHATGALEWISQPHLGIYMRLGSLLCVIAMCLVIGADAMAQSAAECKTGDALGRVIGTGQLHFVNEYGARCPSDETGCRKATYVLPGDVMVTGSRSGKWLCATFPNKNGGSRGWVDTARIAAVPVDSKPPLKAWLGTWDRDADTSIKLTAKGTKIVIDGSAIWNNPATGLPNDGELSGEIAPVRNKLEIKSTDPNECQATLVLVGPYLSVTDNLHCGGLNVNFNGIFRRK